MSARRASVLLALWLSAAVAPAHAAIRAWLDHSHIGAGNSVQLTLEYDGITTSEPDLAPLRRDFAILGSSTSTSVQIGTGGSSETTEVSLTLSPKRTGRLIIPAISWDGERSAPLSLTVTGSSASAPASGAGAPAPANGSAASGGRVFIETSVTPKHPYVQQAVHVSVRIYTSEQLFRGSLDFSGNGAALVRKVGSDVYSNTVRNGQPYQVITRHYLLFPMQSGDLSLPGPQLDAQIATRSSSSWNPFGNVFGGLMQSERPIRVYGDPITLSVRPRPSGAQGSYWLPASKVTLTAHWSSGRQARAGDPLTVHLDLRAVGLTAAQLPDLSALLHPPAGLAAYPDQAKLHNTVQGNLIVGSRDRTIALIADRPGHYTLTGLKVRWWDTRTNQPRVATLPPQSLTILPAPGGTAASAAPAPPAQGAPIVAKAPGKIPAAAARAAHHRHEAGTAFPWQWLSAGLGALWLATLGGWLWSRRRAHRSKPRPVTPSTHSTSSPEPAREQAAFQAACASDDAAGARRHLLLWAQAVWGAPLPGLNALAAALDESRTAELIRELDRACYGGGQWQGRELAQALTGLPQRAGRKPPKDRGLAPLYP